MISFSEIKAFSQQIVEKFQPERIILFGSYAHGHFSTPGVPGSALITMTTVLSAAGPPIEGVAIVAGVDRLTDGFKTVLNIVGNTTNAIILSHWEPEQAAVAAEKKIPELQTNLPS